MRRDALFRHLVHLLGADLHFKGRALFRDHRGVKRLVKIRPRHSDEIFNTTWHRPPQIVNDSQHGVAVLHRLCDHTHGEEVVHLFDCDVLPLQLFVNAVETFDSAFYFRRNPCFLQFVAEYSFYAGQKGLACLTFRLDHLMDLLVADGIHMAETKIFQLAADFAHAETVRNGSIDVQRLLGDFLLSIRGEMLERPHVVQAVSQLDEDHADVVHHRQHHFAQVFGLLFLARVEINLTYFGDALDNVRHLLAKFLADIDYSHRRVFHRIMQQAGDDGYRVHFHFRQNQRNFEGMYQVGFAGSAALAGMMLLGKFVGFAHQFQIFGRPIGLHPAQQLTELGHREHVGRDLLAQCRHDRL